MDRYECGMLALTNEDLQHKAHGYPPKIELLEPIEIVDGLNDIFCIEAKKFVRFGKEVVIFEVHSEDDVVFASNVAMNNLHCKGNVTLIHSGSICGGVIVEGNFEAYADFRTTSSITVGGDLTVHGNLFADGYGNVDVKGNVYVYGGLYTNLLEVGKKLTCNNVEANCIKVSGELIRCAKNISAS